MQSDLIAYFDSGTTNTRLYLLDGDLNPIRMLKRQVGARDSAMEGSNRKLVGSLHEMYLNALEQEGASDRDVREIFMSGMVTSPYGIREVPHQSLPANAKTLADGMATVLEDSFFGREIHLVRGAKTECEDFSLVGNMRGEETELAGIADRLIGMGLKDVAVILPGSHTHIAHMVDGYIADCVSNFTGELLMALGKDTVLAPILEGPSFEVDDEMVALAVRNLDEFGFNRAIYIAHAMKMLNAVCMDRIRSYAYAVINGGIRTVLESTCRTRWQDCHEAVVLGSKQDALFFGTLFKGSAQIGNVNYIESESGSYALDGFRRIYRQWR